MAVQALVVALILALSVGYAAYRVWQALRSASDPCYGCEGCALKESLKASAHEKKGKAPCNGKKKGKKFGGTKKMS